MSSTLAPARLAVGSVYSVGLLSEARLVALAAVAPEGSTDPVDVAAADRLQAMRPGVSVSTSQDFDPARAKRRFSLARVPGFSAPDGSHDDVVVMRGDLEAVLANSTVSRSDRSLVLRNARRARRRGERPLGVASAGLDDAGEVSAFTFDGYVTLLPAELAPRSREDGEWVRVSLWSASLRYQHWLNVALVFILSCTGYLIMDPFIGPSSHSGDQQGFLMGWIRFIHFVAAFIWLVVGATRVVLAFTSTDRFLRWPTLWPLKSKQDLRHLGQILQHYTLIKQEAPLYVAHNPLQQLTYTAVYIACAIQMASGLVLFGLYHQDSAFWVFVATPIHWFGIPAIRLFHTLVMFALWMFVIAHVYLAVRADSLERHGGVSSMINGGVWLRRGARPVDAPGIE